MDQSLLQQESQIWQFLLVVGFWMYVKEYEYLVKSGHTFGLLVVTYLIVVVYISLESHKIKAALHSIGPLSTQVKKMGTNKFNITWKYQHPIQEGLLC